MDGRRFAWASPIDNDRESSRAPFRQAVFHSRRALADIPPPPAQAAEIRAINAGRVAAAE